MASGIPKGPAQNLDMVHTLNMHEYEPFIGRLGTLAMSSEDCSGSLFMIQNFADLWAQWLGVGIPDLLQVDWNNVGYEEGVDKQRKK